MTTAVMVRPRPLYLWVRAVASAYIPDTRHLACARNSFLFRFWNMTTAQLDYLGVYLVRLELCEETRLEKTWGPADQVAHMIDINHPVYGTRITKALTQ